MVNAAQKKRIRWWIRCRRLDDDDERGKPVDDDEFDLYEALGAAKSSISESRCFALYHRSAVDLYREGPMDEFRRLGIAFAVLTDDVRREIYDNLGYASLRASERCNAVDAFDLDPEQIFNDFFDCRHPITREHHPPLKEYLLLEASPD